MKVALFLLMAGSLLADTIELKTGEKIEGVFKEATPSGAIIVVAGKMLAFPLSSVRSIYLGSAPASEKEKPNPAEGDKVKEVAREYIKDHLKAPATAVFSRETLCAPAGKADYEEADGTGPTPECKTPPTDAEVGNGKSVVAYRGNVDAQNGYGALIRSKYLLLVYFANGKFSVLDAAEPSRELKAGCVTMNESYRLTGKREKIRDCDALYPGVK